MFEHYTPDAWMALAKVRHQAALEDAAAYRRLPKAAPQAPARRLRDQLGDWLISAGQRIKPAVPAEPRPALVHPRRP